MRRRSSLMVGMLLIGAASIPQAAFAQSAGLPADANQPLLLAIFANDHNLTDGANAIQSPDGKVYLPAGELGRLLGLDISIDDAAGSLRASTGSKTLASSDFLRAAGETYVRTDVLEELLAITIKLDLPALYVTITRKNPFPFELALERAEQRNRLNGGADRAVDPGPIREAGYEAITLPAIDLILEGDATNDGQQGRTELRAAGDLLFAGYQLYLSTDYDLHPSNLRFTLDRRDFQGGPLDLTRIAAGDVSTPGLSLGPRTTPGRGFFLSNEPLQTVNIFDRLDLRGELPAGWDVELYVNEVLSGSQAGSGNGLYEFHEIPLIYGKNVIRLRFYGPHGEQREEVRQYLVAGGQLPTGKFIYNLGILADGRPLIHLARDQSPRVDGTDGVQYSANIGYGVSPWLTLTGGMGTYQPADKKLFVANIGARTTLGPYSLQLDGALDERQGRAVSAAIAGPFLGGSVVARHAEYGDGFIDQTAIGGGRALRRSTEVRISQLIRMGKLSMPISLLLDQDILSDGTPLLSAHLQTTMGWGGARASIGIGYYRYGDSASQLDAATDLYLFDLEGWRLHATALTRMVPETILDTLQLSAERSIGLNKLLRFGLSRHFGQSASTVANASLWARGKVFDLSLDANYDFGPNSFRIGGRLAFGLIYDPFQGRYVMTKPGAATSGSLAVNAFQDSNGDGIRQAGEPGVRGVSIKSGSYFAAETDENGFALARGMGTGLVPVTVTADTSDDLLYIPPDFRFRAGSRPGKVLLINYPIALPSEIMIHAVYAAPADAAGQAGIADIRLTLISQTGRRFTQTTGADGGAYFTDLPPGNYALELDQDQARELGATLNSPVSILAPAEGGQLLPADAVVNFENDQSNASKG